MLKTQEISVITMARENGQRFIMRPWMHSYARAGRIYACTVCYVAAAFMTFWTGYVLIRVLSGDTDVTWTMVLWGIGGIAFSFGFLFAVKKIEKIILGILG